MFLYDYGKVIVFARSRGRWLAGHQMAAKKAGR